VNGLGVRIAPPDIWPGPRLLTSGDMPLFCAAGGDPARQSTPAEL
jgi:hypothetical protein